MTSTTITQLRSFIAQLRRDTEREVHTVAVLEALLVAEGAPRRGRPKTLLNPPEAAGTTATPSTPPFPTRQNRPDRIWSAASARLDGRPEEGPGEEDSSVLGGEKGGGGGECGQREAGMIGPRPGLFTAEEWIEYRNNTLKDCEKVSDVSMHLSEKELARQTMLGVWAMTIVMTEIAARLARRIEEDEAIAR